VPTWGAGRVSRKQIYGGWVERVLIVSIQKNLGWGAGKGFSVFSLCLSHAKYESLASLHSFIQKYVFLENKGVNFVKLFS
jgi:hypothetical protein